MIKCKVISYTPGGHAQARRLCDASSRLSFRGQQVSVSYNEKDKPMEDCFNDYDAFVFICATGIAVRKIAPLLKDKLTDPALIVMDEGGHFVIPLLSGHVGGANELASSIAKEVGAIPVITTATDVNDVIAIDQLAAANDLSIINRDNIKKVSAGLLRGQAKSIAIADDVVISANENDIDDQVLGLMFRPLVVGIGCRRNKDAGELEAFFLETLQEYGCNIKSVAAIASIDIKAKEPAICALSQKYDIPFNTYSVAELAAVPGDFESSEFVEKTVGVSDVSARAAACCGKRGSFLLKKKKHDGMTISIFEKYRRVTFKYE